MDKIEGGDGKQRPSNQQSENELVEMDENVVHLREQMKEATQPHAHSVDNKNEDSLCKSDSNKSI